MGSGLARKLKLTPGRTLSLFALSKGGGVNTESFTIVGTSSSGIAEVDDISVTMSLADAQTLVDVQTVPSLILFLKNTRDTGRCPPACGSPPGPRRIGFGRADMGAALPFVSGRERPVPAHPRRCPVHRPGVALFSISGTLSVSVIERYRGIGTLRAFGTPRTATPGDAPGRRADPRTPRRHRGLRGGGGVSGLINALGRGPMPPEPGDVHLLSDNPLHSKLSSFLGNGVWLPAAALRGGPVPRDV